MTVHTQVPRSSLEIDAAFIFSFRYRPYEAPGIIGTGIGSPLGFTVTLTPDTGNCTGRAAAMMQAAAAFLVDTAHGLVPAATLAHMIGRLFFANFAALDDAVTVSLANTHGGRITVQLDRPDFEIERTAFGAAHILHEDDTLGLYILEIAPHSAIPAHYHRVMRECELILEDGLLQQDRPVARGNAYAWPLGYVHAYRNPTGTPRRILCIDSPRFMPSDEVALLSAPLLVPMKPVNNYLI